jgi:hypothetical protein
MPPTPAAARLRTDPAGGTVAPMAVKDTILGWLRRTPDKSEELEEAAIGAATEEYSAERADDFVDQVFMTSPDEFEDDQDAPRR